MPLNDCEKFVEKVSNFIDGEVDQDEREFWDKHLSKCGSCSALLQRTQNLGMQLRKLTQVKVTRDFDAVLRARIRKEGQRRPWPRILSEPIVGWRIPAYGTIAALFIAMPLLLLSQIRQGDINTYRRVVITPITNSQLNNQERIKNIVDTSGTRQVTNYVLDQVTLEELLKNRKGIPLSSEGLAKLEQSQSDSMRHSQKRIQPPAQYVSHKRTGIRF